MPLISVLMSVYKESNELLKQSIESILNQSFRDFELICILDNPENTDALALISYYSKLDNRIQLLVNEKNLGLARSLNRGLELTNAEFIARMDADDISFSNRLEIQLNYIKKQNLDLIGGSINRIDLVGNIIDPNTNPSYSPECIRKLLRFDDCVPHPTWFVKSEVYKTLGGYRDIFACEDYDFLLRAIRANYRIGMCDDIVLQYRVNATGISNTNLLKQRLASHYLRKNYFVLNYITPKDIENYIERIWKSEDAQKYYEARNELNRIIRKIKNHRFPIMSIMGCIKKSSYIANDCLRIGVMQLIKMVY